MMVGCGCCVFASKYISVASRVQRCAQETMREVPYQDNTWHMHPYGPPKSTLTQLPKARSPPPPSLPPTSPPPLACQAASDPWPLWFIIEDSEGIEAPPDDMLPPGLLAAATSTRYIDIQGGAVFHPCYSFGTTRQSFRGFCNQGEVFRMYVQIRSSYSSHATQWREHSPAKTVRKINDTSTLELYLGTVFIFINKVRGPV